MDARARFQAQVVGLAMLGSTYAFAAVGWWLARSGRAPLVDPGTGTAVVLAWGLATVGASLGWLRARRAAVEPGAPAGRTFAMTILACGLAEATGILGVVTHLTTGEPAPMLAGLGLATAGIGFAVARRWPTPVGARPEVRT